MKRISAESICLLLDELRVGLTLLTPSGQIFYRNRYAEQMMNSGNGCKESVLECHPPSLHGKVQKQLLEVSQHQIKEFHQILPIENNYIENFYSSCNTGGGPVVAMISRDVTGREQANVQLREALAELELLYEAARLLGSSLDYDHNLQHMLDILRQEFHFERIAIWLGDQVEQISLLYQSGFPPTGAAAPQAVRQVFRQKQAVETCEGSWVKAVPLEVFGQIHGVLLMECCQPPVLTGSQQRTLASIVTLTSAAVMNARRFLNTEKIALEDQLTGLYNRQRLNQVISQLQTSRPAVVGALMIDVNRLKQINDTYGHEAGDTAIKGAAEVLSRSTRRETLFRYGGDEFLVIIENADRQTLETILRRIRLELAGWNKSHQDFPLPLSLSIGWATSRKPDVAALIRRADLMMYRDKQRFYASLKAL